MLIYSKVIPLSSFEELWSSSDPVTSPVLKILQQRPISKQKPKSLRDHKDRSPPSLAYPTPSCLVSLPFLLSQGLPSTGKAPTHSLIRSLTLSLCSIISFPEKASLTNPILNCSISNSLISAHTPLICSGLNFFLLKFMSGISS